MRHCTLCESFIPFSHGATVDNNRVLDIVGQFPLGTIIQYALVFLMELFAFGMLCIDMLQILMWPHVLHHVEIASTGPLVVPKKRIQGSSANGVRIREITVVG